MNLSRSIRRRLSFLLPAQSFCQSTPIAYWDGLEKGHLSKFFEHWAAYYPTFEIMDDSHVIGLIEEYLIDYVDVYKSIRVPAGKADIARYILLYARGGLYIDCNAGVRDIGEIRRLISKLDNVELVLFDRLASVGPKRIDEHIFYNGIIMAQKGSGFMLECARQSLINYAWLKSKERMQGHVPYDIWWMSGPGLLTAIVTQPGSQGRQLKRGHEGRILVLKEEDGPIVRGVNRTYSSIGSGLHWSERQRREMLFQGG